MTIGRKEFILPVNMLGLRQLFYETIGCCCKKGWYSDYKQTMNQVETDMRRQMDVLTFVKTRRAYGLAFSVLFDEKSRRLIFEKSRGKPIEPVSDEEVLFGTHACFKEEVIKEIKNN